MWVSIGALGSSGGRGGGSLGAGAGAIKTGGGSSGVADCGSAEILIKRLGAWLRVAGRRARAGLGASAGSAAGSATSNGSCAAGVFGGGGAGRWVSSTIKAPLANARPQPAAAVTARLELRRGRGVAGLARRGPRGATNNGASGGRARGATTTGGSGAGAGEGAGAATGGVRINRSSGWPAGGGRPGAAAPGAAIGSADPVSTELASRSGVGQLSGARKRVGGCGRGGKASRIGPCRIRGQGERRA